MSNFLKLVGGIPTSTQVEGTDIGSGVATNGQALTANGSGGSAFTTIPVYVSIYDQIYSVGSTITSGTPVTLPSSGSYTGNELEVYLNGIFLSFDSNGWQTSGGGPTYTAVTFAGNLINGDYIHFRKTRTQ